MEKKGSWISALKKALTPESKEKKDKKSPKWKSKWFGKHKSLNSSSPPVTPTEEMKLAKAENEQNKHAYSAALATAMAAETAIAAAQAAAEVVRLRAAVHYLGKSKEEVAATKIQTAFRGYLGRRELRALRGLARLKSLIQSPSVKRQATTTLRGMQTMARVQSQIRARKIQMSEENEILRRQLQQKCENELEKFGAPVEEDWNASVRSKEQIEANLQSKQEAAMRRERALAYAYTHQQVLKNSSQSANHKTFMDPNYPHWGWSWLERWMASRPWENKNTLKRELYSNHTSIERAFPIRKLSKSHSCRNLNLQNIPSPTTTTPRRQSPSTNASRAPSVSSKGCGCSSGGADSRSMLSFRSEWNHRRHSIAGSSVGDSQSLASCPSIPRYMEPTESAKAKTRPFQIPSPLGNGTLEKGSASSAKKRLSFSSSPAGTRRHYDQPKLDINVHSGKKPSRPGPDFLGA